MGSAIVRQWLVLSMLPSPPRRIDAGAIEARLRARGVAVHRRTIQRDLVELSEVFPIVADLRSKPYGWRWSEPSPIAGRSPHAALLSPAESSIVADVGQRSATETLFGIIAAFIEKRTWTQADLARRLETRPETIRKRLFELVDNGFKLEREDDHPHVYWSAPKNWFPGALVFKQEEVGDLLRLIARAPRGALRDKQLALIVDRLANLGHAGKATVDTDAVRPPEVGADEERWLSIIEDAAAKKVSVKMRYFSASRREDSSRHVSVHRIDLGARPHFIATCHQANALKRFRLSNVSEARPDTIEPFRATTKEALDTFDGESFGGFRGDGPVVTCSFVVRDAEAVWVARNLPAGNFAHERLADGVRFRIATTAVASLARYVVGLGAAAKPETPELAAHVRELARGALKSAE